MKISGKELAHEVYEDIQKKLIFLTEKNIVPHLIIVKSSNIDAVNNYIGQKIKKGEKVGVKVEVVELDNNDCKHKEQIKEKIIQTNKSLKNHGIIFQKPGHLCIDEEVESLVDTDKDVDGFLKHSSHKPPVYMGVIKVLGSIFRLSGKKLISFLKKKNIVLIGKGKTGGGTIISGLKQDKFDIDMLKIIDSKSNAKERIKYIRRADIIISAVGKQNPVDFHLFSKKTTLIDIGVHFDSNNKIKGDFNEEDIKGRVSNYTTTPGGIGALTVAYLMNNVVNAAWRTVKN